MITTIVLILAWLWAAYGIVRAVADIRKARREAAMAVEAAKERVRMRRPE